MFLTSSFLCSSRKRLDCEWHLIPRWLLRSIFALFQLLNGLVYWGSPGKYSTIEYFFLDAFWVLSRQFWSTSCSAVRCSAADKHLKLQDCLVRGASFLNGSVFECDLAHHRSLAVLCMLYKIRCNLMHPLYGVLPVPYVPVRVTRGTSVHLC